MAFRFYHPRTTGPSRGSSTGTNIVAKVRRPPALSAARALSILAIVVFVVIVAYVGVAIYSATQVNATSGGWHASPQANDAFELDANATIRNPGIFAATALDVGVAVSPWPPCGGGVIHASIVRVGSIPGQSTMVLPITIQLPAPSACGYSATQPPPHAVTLSVDIWSNATYAGISNFTVHAVTSVVATLPTPGATPSVQPAFSPSAMVAAVRTGRGSP